MVMMICTLIKGSHCGGETYCHLEKIQDSAHLDLLNMLDKIWAVDVMLNFEMMLGLRPSFSKLYFLDYFY